MGGHSADRRKPSALALPAAHGRFAATGALCPGPADYLILILYDVRPCAAGSGQRRARDKLSDSKGLGVRDSCSLGPAATGGAESDPAAD